MTLILVTVIIICISYCAYSEDNLETNGTHDIVKCVFTINPNSHITIRAKKCFSIFAKQQLKNIGINKVIVKGFSGATVEPCCTKRFRYPFRIYNKHDSDRAIVYASACEDKRFPEVGYDENKVLRETFNLGVKYISKEYSNLSTLLSNFWPEKEENVWEKIYNIVKNLLSDKCQYRISKVINGTIAYIKNELVALNKMTEQKFKSEFEEKYNNLFCDIARLEDSFIILKNNKGINDLYVSALHSNFVTMQMYFYLIGLSMIEQDHHLLTSVRVRIRILFESSYLYIKEMIESPFHEIYMTACAGGLYNVMMNARSYYAVHVLEMFPVWKNIYKYVHTDSNSHNSDCPFSYSILYGRATPDLLQQAIHIKESALAVEDQGEVVKLNRILYYIRETEIEEETVYGLKLEFSDKISKTMGTTKSDTTILVEQSLSLRNRHISELNVYKTKYIKCLELILSDRKMLTIGNHCKENSENFTFKSEGHYISSLYLANDFPGTEKYFDNVAVSYLPKPL